MPGSPVQFWCSGVVDHEPGHWGSIDEFSYHKVYNQTKAKSKCKRCASETEQLRKRGYMDRLRAEFMEFQGYVCAICDKPFMTPTEARVDHCHTTSLARGALCNSCNIFCGYVEKNPHLIEKILAHVGIPLAKSIA